MTMTKGARMLPGLSNLDEAFETFHAAHPDVYTELVRLARDAHRRGQTRIGIGMLWEVLRWRQTLTEDHTGYKLNNNLRSRYARLLVANEPELATMFTLRDLRS